MPMTKRIISVLALCTALAACGRGSVTGSVGENTFGAPSALSVCSGYGCVYKEPITLTKADHARLQRIMMPKAKDAAAERQKIAEAIAVMERMSLSKLRFHRDTAFAYQKLRGLRGQMDCVDESLNTIAYLTYLQKQGWLTYHKPISTFAERGFLLDGRYPHKSARIRQNNGQDWAVDSWFKANGQQPIITPLKAWYKQRNNSTNYGT